MKSFLVVSFSLTALTFVSGRILNETASLQRPRTTRTQHQPPKIFWRPRTRELQKFEEIIYAKHLMELKCLKKIFEDTRDKNRLRYLKPYRITKPVMIPPTGNFQKQGLVFQDLRPNIVFIEPRSRINAGNNRIIFLPDKGRFKGGQPNKIQQIKTSQHSRNEFMHQQNLENLNKKTQNSKFSHLIDNRRENEEQTFKEIPKVFIPHDDIPKHHHRQNFQQKQNEKSLFPVHPIDSYRSQQQTKPIPLYEPIKEMMRDSFVEGNNDDIKNHQENEKVHLESFFAREEHGKKPDTIKSNSIDINNGRNTVLKSLTESGNSSTKANIIYNYNHNNYSKALYNFSTTLDNSFYNKQTTKIVVKSQTQSEELKITPSYYYKTTEGSTDRSTNTTQTPAVLDYFDDVKNLSIQNLTIKNQESSNSDITTESSTAIKEKFIENLLNLSKTVNETVTNTNSSDKVTEKPTDNANEMGIKSPEKRPILPEFTDHPFTIDLLTIKKDQETIWKNSRKMHFDQEILTTVSDQTAEPEKSERRRSDILINENLDEYTHHDSDLSSNYLMELNKKKFLNLTTEHIIQLIPLVIDDLREGRISPEDISNLSKAFGHYWAPVEALTNYTDLDMLQVVKMKDEKDFKKILDTFFPENSFLTTTELKNVVPVTYPEYSYEEEFEDFYWDQEDLEEKEAFRFKRDLRNESRLMSEVSDGNIDMVI